MKRITLLLLLMLLLSGCSGNDAMDRAMNLRARLLAAKSCSFDAEITADYGNKTYTFAMGCQTDAHGDLSFTVQEPQTIAGITGSITQEGGKLTYDGTALSFALLADDQVTPVSAPWILMRSLRSGYLTSCGADGELTRLIIDDSYAEDALTLHIWLDSADTPVQADIIWDGRRILTVTVKDFTIA